MTAVIPSNIGARRVSLPSRPFDAALKAIIDIDGLTGLWEAGDTDNLNGFRWKAKWGADELTPYRNFWPLVVAGSHGRPAVQMGYGDPVFAGTERGALCVGENAALLGATGFTVIMVVRCASASETGGTVGGYLAAGRNEQGDNPDQTVTPDDTDFRLIVQSSSGRPRLRAGGATVEAAVDLVTAPAHHVITAHFDDGDNLLGLRIDGGSTVSSVAAAGAMPSHAGALAPIFGVFNSANALPFYGQISAIATANRNLPLADKRLIEARFGDLYGIAVTP